MKKLLFFLISIPLLFTSCSSDDNDGGGNNNDAINVSIEVLHNTDNQKNVSDIGSIVYLFEGFSMYNGGDWVYSGNGAFHSNKWGTNWTYTHKVEVTETGASFSGIKGTDGYKYFTVVVESNSDQNKEKRYYPVKAFNIEGKNLKLSYFYGSDIFLKE